MPILVVLIVLAFSFYVFYKIKQARSRKPAEKKWISAKASIALGLFVGLYGVNQLFMYSSTTTYVVAIVFVVLGGLSAFTGYKQYKFYLPHAREEAIGANKS